MQVQLLMVFTIFNVVYQIHNSVIITSFEPVCDTLNIVFYDTCNNNYCTSPYIGAYNN